MKIYYLTPQHNKQLFRCLVVPADGSEDCTHDATLHIYAKPEEPPAIEYTRHSDQTGGCNVTCSISHVFPLTFPVFGSKEENGSKGILLNNDGTFNTNVTTYFSRVDGDTTIECLYSLRNFKSKSSLRIVDYGDISERDGEEDCVDKNNTDSNFRCRSPGLWLLWTILIMEVLLVVLISYTIMIGRLLLRIANRDSNHADDRLGHGGAANLEYDDTTVANLNSNSSENRENTLISRKLFHYFFAAIISLVIHMSILIMVIILL
ncbi:uncharacterized protein LOC135155027 [Lytechinus pictus]|uniref:uncharacterized protein LOC135155027 n=1 Tax=Lytechinus pictus TaxID=7653 RepID=UPI0030B9EB74